MMTQEEYVNGVLALKRQGKTMTEIAVELGYHPATISGWLKNGGPPAARTIEPARALIDERWSARIRELIQDQGATPNIPPKSNRRWKPCFSKRLYRERNLIERFFSKLKHFRRVATRYDKLAANFLAMVKLASMRLWLRAYESTA